MRFRVRRPSLKRRIRSRTSIKRHIVHRVGIKMPRGTGWIHVRNKIYRRIPMYRLFRSY